jgi:hypothetical protein
MVIVYQCLESHFVNLTNYRSYNDVYEAKKERVWKFEFKMIKLKINFLYKILDSLFYVQWNHQCLWGTNVRGFLGHHYPQIRIPSNMLVFLIYRYYSGCFIHLMSLGMSKILVTHKHWPSWMKMILIHSIIENERLRRKVSKLYGSVAG